MPNPVLPDFSNPFKNFKNMSHREIMIATGQISGDEPGTTELNLGIFVVHMLSRELQVIYLQYS